MGDEILNGAAKMHAEDLAGNEVGVDQLGDVEPVSHVTDNFGDVVENENIEDATDGEESEG